MKEFAKEAPKGVLFKIHVHPQKREFKIKEISQWHNALVVETKEMPVMGKANLEIEEKLSEFFHAKCRIVSGKQGKEKNLIAETTMQDFKKRLESL